VVGPATHGQAPCPDARIVGGKLSVLRKAQRLVEPAIEVGRPGADLEGGRARTPRDVLVRLGIATPSGPHPGPVQPAVGVRVQAERVIEQAFGRRVVELLCGSHRRGPQRARRQCRVAAESGVVRHLDRVCVGPAVQEVGRCAVQQRLAAGCRAGRQRDPDQVVPKRKGPA